MNLREFGRMLQARWIIVAASVLVGLLAAVIVTFMTTPLYQATTRLFVSAASGGNTLSDKYQGTLDSQQRVLSYTQLITGQTLAQRTINKLGLDLSAKDLADEIRATARPDTVLIDVAVSDESPVRARDIANTASDEFVGMVRELETPEDGSKADARVIVEQRASLPESPITPKKPRNIMLGLAFGVLIGISVAFIHNYLDNTVKDRDVLQAITGTGIVGNIPQDKQRRKEPAISFDGDNSAIAEAFRKLRTNLQFLSVDNPPRVIVVTSSMPNEGKSTTAINIALALAEADHRVLLVDGDMRRPMLDKYLNLVGSVGLSTVLSGAASLADVLQETPFPRVSVLAAGTNPPNPSELLGSLAAQKLIGEMRANYDYVVIDSSPLLAVTDAAVLAAKSDGVLLMARFGQSKREHVAQAVQILNSVDAPLLGAVFTMTSARGDSSYNYSYYGDDMPTKP